MVSKFAQRIRFSMHNIYLPGLGGSSLYEVYGFFIKALQKGSIGTRAAAFSFNFFLALFPAIIFFFTIIPYVPVEGFQDKLLDLLGNFIPEKTYESVRSTLFDIIKRPRGGLLSLGFVMALYFSTNGIFRLIDAFNQSRHTVDKRTWVQKRLVSIALVLITSLLIVLSIIILSLSPLVVNLLIKYNLLRMSVGYYLIMVGKWIVITAMLLLGYSFLYYLGPAAESRFKFISAGSLLSTSLTILATIGFNYYVNNLSRYNTLYGSIGTLIILMVWINFLANIIIIGFELNVSILNAQKNNEYAESVQ